MSRIRKKIKSIEFGLMSPEIIREMSVVKIETPNIYDDTGYPIENGLMDPRLGVTELSLKCRTCGFRGGECQGHFGRIELARPVIHVGFADTIHKILRSTCNECGHILLDEVEIEEFHQKMIEAKERGENLDKIIKEVYAKAEKDECSHCGEEQEDIKLDKPTSIIQGDYKLTPSEVREKLKRINDKDAFILGVNPKVARPEWMVLTVLPVPPITIRPNSSGLNGTIVDDLTIKLADILRINQKLTENMEAGAPQLIIEDLWELLQYHITTYFDNEAIGIPPVKNRQKIPLKSLMQRLKGKDGRFVNDLLSKPVNFTATSIISPDPNLSIDEVGVPIKIAKELTIAEYVTEWNIDNLREIILKGPYAHPGANYVKKGIRSRYNKIRILNNNKEVVCENLKYGDIVVRHLKDGDIVIFNHKPSDYKQSMLAHKVKVLPYETFRFNPILCSSYNAVFDGETMNLHVLQNEESRSEAKSLMSVEENILSPIHGKPIIGAISDYITGIYLLTRIGSEFKEDSVYQIINKCKLFELPWKQNNDGKYIKSEGIGKEVTSKTNMYLDRKKRNWTGKELFSLLLPYDLNMTYKAEICHKCQECEGIKCPYDSYVVIENGELIYGAIDDKAYGSFSGKILDKIVKEYGPSAAKDFLDSSTKLAICGIMKTGITTSTNDEELPEEATEHIEEHLDKAEQKVNQLIEDYEEDYLEALPGKSVEETLEIRIMQVLNEAKDKSGVIAEEYFTLYNNNSLVMSRTGAIPNPLSFTQNTACLGQQTVNTENYHHIKKGYENRLLPHFRKYEKGIKSKGFIYSNYKKGLNPIEYFLHSISGRHTLTKEYLKNKELDLVKRDLRNALSDLKVNNEGLVTDSKGNIIQTLFGEDGLDPAKIELGKLTDINRFIDEIRTESKTNYDYNTFNNSYVQITENELKEKMKKKELKLEHSIKERENRIKREEEEAEKIRKIKEEREKDKEELRKKAEKRDQIKTRIDDIKNSFEAEKVVYETLSSIFNGELKKHNERLMIKKLKDDKIKREKEHNKLKDKFEIAQNNLKNKSSNNVKKGQQTLNITVKETSKAKKRREEKEKLEIERKQEEEYRKELERLKEERIEVQKIKKQMKTLTLTQLKRIQSKHNIKKSYSSKASMINDLTFRIPIKNLKTEVNEEILINKKEQKTKEKLRKEYKKRIAEREKAKEKKAKKEEENQIKTAKRERERINDLINYLENNTKNQPIKSNLKQLIQNKTITTKSQILTKIKKEEEKLRKEETRIKILNLCNIQELNEIKKSCNIHTYSFSKEHIIEELLNHASLDKLNTEVNKILKKEEENQIKTAKRERERINDLINYLENNTKNQPIKSNLKQLIQNKTITTKSQILTKIKKEEEKLRKEETRIKKAKKEEEKLRKEETRIRKILNLCNIRELNEIKKSCNIHTYSFSKEHIIEELLNHASLDKLNTEVNKILKKEEEKNNKNTIKCSNCGKEVHIKYINCPYCSHRVKKGTTVFNRIGNLLKKTKKCPKCNSELNRNANFCTECGYNFMEQYCIHCGQKLKQDAMYCTNCGKKV